jgi:hypothetical protein
MGRVESHFFSFIHPVEAMIGLALRTIPVVARVSKNCSEMFIGTFENVSMHSVSSAIGNIFRRLFYVIREIAFFDFLKVIVKNILNVFFKFH